MTLLPWWRRLSSSGASWRILRIWCRQGDTGQGWLKIGLNDVMKKDLEKEQGMRVAAAGTEFSMEDKQEGGLARKISRRTKKQGMGGGTHFSDRGARKIIMLAVVKKVPESYYNLGIIFDSIGLNRIPFKLTGDFAFIMPITGCAKACGGTNPCSLYDQEKTTAGGQGSRWVEGEVHLQTLGSLSTNYGAWMAEGEKMLAAATRKRKGVCASPLHDMSEAQGRGFDVCLLDLIVPATLHLIKTDA